ncbi:MAG: hypothetical protein IKU34_09985 [Clostridia bacterium]|nr:hypothetical protein [Clostridia bacterium]
MNTVFMLRRVRAFFIALDERLARFRFVIGAVLAAALCAGFALMSVYAGPLYNLNDIGGFDPRKVFIVLAAAVYLTLLLLTAALCRANIYRMVLREMIVTAGFVILLGGINQKTYYFTQNLQPLLSLMDGKGLAGMSGYTAHLSAPMATLLYLITRGPVYAMYMVKLACIAALAALCIMAAHAADQNALGLRAEALLALCLILPCGFMSAACTALPDVISVALLAASLMLALQEKSCPVMKWTAAALYGLALACGGLSLYALPVFIWLAINKRMTVGQLAVSLALAPAACLPAIACGVPAGEAFLSLVSMHVALPEYAAGSPGMMSLIPRALVEEMPAMFQLQRLAQIDSVTYAQPYYTQAHYELASLGFALCAPAVFGGVAALIGRKKMTVTARAFALVLCALLVCPGVTNGAWIAACVIALYAIMKERSLRLPACMVLFAVSGAAAYPMLGETLVPMVLAFALCLCALLMVLDVIPASLAAAQRDQ